MSSSKTKNSSSLSLWNSQAQAQACEFQSLEGKNKMALKSQSRHGVFGDVYSIIKDMEIDHHNPTLQFSPFTNLFASREVREFISGALAGAMTKAILAPLETIRTRMVIEQQGWQGLWAGNMINMLRIIPTQAIELGTFECVKRSMTSVQEKWKQNEHPNLQIGCINFNLPLSCISPVAIAGAAAGVAGTLVCHPLEVLK
ncbi:putative mitochondrial adenine nucleotide transporter BTL1, partial [Mucuna pruriens]